jgi:hypothetical protein
VWIMDDSSIVETCEMNTLTRFFWQQMYLAASTLASVLPSLHTQKAADMSDV